MRQSDRVVLDRAAADSREFAGEFVGLNGGADFYVQDIAGLGREGRGRGVAQGLSGEVRGSRRRAPKAVFGDIQRAPPAGVAIHRCSGSERSVSLPDPSEIETEAGQDRVSVNAVGVVEHLDGSAGR